MTVKIIKNFKKAININWWVDSLYYSKAIAIEIKPDTVNFLCMDKNISGIRLLDYKSLSINLTFGSEIKKEDEGKFLSEFQQFISKNKIGNETEIVLSIPKKLVISKFIEVPSPDEKNLKNILSYDLERHIPISKEDVCFDFSVIEKTKPNHYRILLVAAQKEAMDYYKSLFKRFSVSPSIIYLSSFSQINLYKFCNDNGNGTSLLFDTDKENIKLDLVKNGHIAWSKEYPLSRVKSNGVNQLAYDGSDASVNKYFEFVKIEISRMGNVIDSDERENLSILFTNPDIKWQKLLKKLNEENIEARSIDPISKVKNNLQLNENERDNVKSAMGIGLRAVSGFFLNINLLPGRKKNAFKKKNVIITLLLLSTFIITLFISMFGGYIKGKIELNRLDKILISHKKELSELEGLGVKSLELEKNIKEFIKIQKDTKSKLNILKELSDIVPSSIWISQYKVFGEQIEIAGFAASASGLIKTMEDSDLFKEVKFLGTIKKEAGKEKFKVTATLE